MTTDYLKSAQALADLKRLNARFIHNFITNDVASHDAILHPDFITIQSDGEVVKRAEYLRRWATGFDPEVIIYWDVRNEFIDIFGNVGLVRSTNKHVMKQDGGLNTAMTIYTDAYVYEDSVWKCIQAQITRIVGGNEPGDETIISIYRNGILQER